MVRPRLRGAEPEVPFHGRRDVMHLRRPHDALGPDWAVGPEPPRVDVPDRTRLDPFANLPRAVAGVALIAHLRGLLRPLRCLGRELPRFPDGSGERLLGVDVL